MAGMGDSWGLLSIRRQVFRKEKKDACFWHERNKGEKNDGIQDDKKYIDDCQKCFDIV